jgi:hypothetical protein
MTGSLVEGGLRLDPGRVAESLEADVRASSVSCQVAVGLRRRCRHRRSHLAGESDRPRDQPESHQRPDPTEDRDSDLPRKEVIQPHLPVRLPCYDFVPITNPTFDGCLLAVGAPASGVASFHDVTGGVYKAREHIHRRMLTGGY